MPNASPMSQLIVTLTIASSCSRRIEASMLLPDCVDGPAHENRKHFHAIPPGDLDAIAASKVFAIALSPAGGPSGIEGAANQIRFELPPSAGLRAQPNPPPPWRWRQDRLAPMPRRY